MKLYRKYIKIVQVGKLVCLDICIFILVIALSLIIIPESVEAEVMELHLQMEENWNVDELTHCWDQEIDVHDIDVSDGGLRLENVTLTAHGKITISHPSVWEGSTIIHNTSNNEDTILLESQLTVNGTNLTINAQKESMQAQILKE